jgi:hypothetical protein
MEASRSSARIAMPVAEAADGRALAQYQDGAVVNKTLYANDAGTITLLAFAAGPSPLRYE